MKINNEKKACRNGFGDALVEVGLKNKNVVAICADLPNSTMMDKFQQKIPKRYFDVGVAEQNLVTAASGMAHVGKIPYVSGFGAFVPGRCWEQIRTTICYNNNNVKIVATHTGLNVGEDGATHQMLEDLALMRSLPNMIVIQPVDYEQAKKATHAMGKLVGPAYMRVGRYKAPQITTSKDSFVIGKAQTLKDGKDVAIIGCGPLVIEGLKAALEMKDTSVRVINMHTIKPLDSVAIVKAAKECGKIITIEDHQIDGGLGSAIAEVVSEKHPVKIIRMGMPNKFGESGTDKELFDKYNLNVAGIKNNIKKIMK